MQSVTKHIRQIYLFQHLPIKITRLGLVHRLFTAHTNISWNIVVELMDNRNYTAMIYNSYPVTYSFAAILFICILNEINKLRLTDLWQPGNVCKFSCLTYKHQKEACQCFTLQNFLIIQSVKVKKPIIEQIKISGGSVFETGSLHHQLFAKEPEPKSTIYVCLTK